MIHGIVASGGANSGGGGPTDPNFANVSLLLHFEGSNGSTTFTDSSSNTLTGTANGDAQISTAQFKFGTASGLFDGTGDFISYSDVTALELGSGDWTIETFVRFSALPTSGNVSSIGSRFVGTGNQRSYIFFQFNNGGTQQLAFQYSNDGASGVLRSVNFTPSLNTWYHYAVTRSGGNLRFFVDGTQIGSTQVISGTLFNSTAGLEIGNLLNGYLDEYRVTKGVARYTSNFTAPSAPFPDS